MAALQSENLNGLEGWGSFKKKIGLNKLHTRAVTKTALKAVGLPTKKNVKAAVTTAAASPGVNALLNTVGNVALPGVGSLLAQGLNYVQAKELSKQISAQENAAGVVEYYDANGQKITKEQYDTIMALANQPEPQAAATSVAEAGQRMRAKWPKYVLMGSAGLLGLAVIFRIAGVGNGGTKT